VLICSYVCKVLVEQTRKGKVESWCPFLRSIGTVDIEMLSMMTLLRAIACTINPLAIGVPKYWPSTKLLNLLCSESSGGGRLWQEW
jgi:hypothetical protein